MLTTFSAVSIDTTFAPVAMSQYQYDAVLQSSYKPPFCPLSQNKSEARLSAVS